MSILHRDRTQTAELSDTDVLAAAYEIVAITRDFISVEQLGDDIVDDTELPLSRSTIVNAFRLAIATEPRTEVRQDLIAAGCLLAQFQPGVGVRISVTPARMASQESEHEHPYPKHVDCLFNQVSADRRVLRDLFGNSALIAEQKFGRTRFHPPFQDDGTYTPHGHGNIKPQSSTLVPLPLQRVHDDTVGKR
jgi:hypothetical protein